MEEKFAARHDGESTLPWSLRVPVAQAGNLPAQPKPNLPFAQQAHKAIQSLWHQLIHSFAPQSA